MPSEQLAREMTAAYFADTDALGIGRPDFEPLAAETIGPIEDYIQALIDGGHAYAVDGDVYFRVRSDPEYGSLSHRDVDSMDQGEGVENARLKQDPLDFALWKAHKEGEDTHWRAPWGEGRPGWHIECSAMAEQGLPGGGSTSTAAARTSCSPTTRTRRPRRARRGAKSWRGSGCTTA